MGSHNQILEVKFHINFYSFSSSPNLFLFYSWCRDCVGLTVEISYMGHPFKRPLLALNSAEQDVQRMVKTDLFPKLDWTVNLKKFVLFKYGNFENRNCYRPAIRSLLLDDLCAFIFPEERQAPSSLECVWIHDFLLGTPLLPHWLNSSSKKSYCDTELHRVNLSIEAIYQTVLQEGAIGQLGGIAGFPTQHQREAHPQPYLPDLKYCHVGGYVNHQVF